MNNTSLPVFLSSDQAQMNGHDLYLGEVYEYILSSEWGHEINPIANYENLIDERISSSQSDANDNCG